MIVLKASNKSAVDQGNITYTAANYTSATATLTLKNVTNITADDYLLLGEIGSETTEIVQAGTVTAAPTNTVAIKGGGTTKFAHSESTRVSVVKYNQVRFFWTAAATFDTSNALTGYQDLAVDDFYSRYYDTVNSTGFGWFIFYNSTTNISSAASNAIPYADFGENSVKKIIDTFYSMMNNKEISLITHADAMSYLNEAYAIATNELNLINIQYNVPATWTLTFVAGTAEYALPANFGHMLGIGDQNQKPISNMNAKEVITSQLVTTDTWYYIRGNYIGFYPTPTSNNVSTTANITYTTISTRLTSLYDNCVLPLNNYYFLLDYMMYRACPKLGRPDETARLAAFQSGINRMKITALKQDARLDSWGIDDCANV